MAAGRIKGITIEIGGDTTKLVKALASVDNAISKTQQNLRDINKALKFDPSNVNLLKDKQRELASQIDETKKKLETEKQALEQMKNTEGFDANSRAARDLQLQIDLDTAALKELEAQARQSASVLGTQMQVAGEKIQQVGNKIKGVGDRLAGIGRSMTTYVTTPIVTGLGAAIKTTGEFDAAMSKVQAVSGATAGEVSQLRELAEEMGKTTKFSASEAAEGLNYMAMAGWKTEQMLGGLKGIMNLAAASGEELGTTSDIVTDALTAFGMSAEESSRFADVLAAAASNANTNVAMMGESFKYVAPVAGSLDYTIEDISLALGLMANAGIKADMAGTSLRNMLTRMAKPTKESAMAMERLGIELYNEEGKMYSFREIMDQLRVSMANININIEDYDEAVKALDDQLEDGTLTQKKYEAALEELNLQTFGAEGAEKARAAAMLGGTRAMSGLLAIANASTDDYNKLANAIDNSSQSFAKLADGSVVPLSEALASGQEILEKYNGAAEAMAAIMMDNLPGQLTILKSNIEAMAISIGNLLMPKIREIVSKIQEWVERFNALSDEEKMQIIKMAGIAAAIGPVLLIVGKLVSAFGSIVSFAGGAVKGIGTLITTFKGLTMAGGGLEAVMSAISGPIGVAVLAVTALAGAFAYLYTTSEEFRNSINAALGRLKEQFESVKESIKPLWEELKRSAGELIKTLEPVIKIITTLVLAFASGVLAALGPILEFVTNMIDTITNIVKALFALLSGDFDGFVSYISAALSSFLDGITALINGVVQFWLSFFQMFGVNLQQIFTTLWNGIKLTVSTVLTNISTTIQTVWNNIKTWITTTLTNILDKFKEIFENIYNAVKEKIDNVKKTIVEGMEKAVEYIKSLPGKFFSWGADMVQGIIDGIQSKIEAVRAKISELASLMASYIHFSEPDVGPLSDFHTYMPDMMNELVKGINDSIPRVAQAMNGLAGVMVPQVSGQSLMGGTSTNTFNINVYGAQGQNVSELADVIEQRITENVMRRGVAFGG